jgi:hypothetical protein
MKIFVKLAGVSVVLCVALSGCGGGGSSNPGAIATPLTPTTPSVEGTALYDANCARCHGPLATSTKRGKSAAQIQAAITNNTGGMGSLSTLTLTQISAIATALGTDTTTPTTPQNTISQNNTSVSATSNNDSFKLENNPTVSYEATISGGFKYPADKISYPSGTNRPSALAGGVNDLIDGKVLLTWIVNGKVVLINLTGLDAISEGALQSSAPDAAANIYTTY